MLTELKEGLSYLRSNPTFLVAAAKNATRLNLSVPVDFLRWMIDRRPRGKGPERIDVSAAPPGLALGLTVDLYGTKLDVGAHIDIESVDNDGQSLRIALRVEDLSLKAPPGSPAAMMLSSLDTAHPANLVKMMPAKHAMLVEAEDDRFVLDLLQIPKLAKNRTLRRILDATSGVISIREIRTEDDLMLIGISVNPLGLPAALARLRAG
jgi:hypothetical protein